MIEIALLAVVTIIAYLYATTRLNLIDCQRELEWANASIARNE